MNNIQLYLTIGIPTITVVLAWLSSRSDNNRTNDKIDRLGERLNTKVDHLADTLRVEMNALRNDLNRDMVAFRKDIHADLMMLHERVVKVETRQES